MRYLDFNDSYSSASEPNTTNISAGSFNSFANDAAFVSAKGTNAETGDVYFNTTLNDIRFYDNSEWHTNESELNNITASDPTSTDDTNDGYEVFSQWVNSSDSGCFVCLDATGTAAIWKEIAYQETIDAKFNTSTGHDHDGSDSKKVLGANIDSTGGSANQFLIADGVGGSSWSVPSISPDFGAIITSADTTLSQAGNDLIFVDASSTNVTISLPTAIGNEGTIFRFNRIDANGTNAVIIDGYSTETINASQTTAMYGQYSSYQIASDGTGWYSISDHTPQIAYIKDIKPNNVSGGTFTSGSWQTRVLNTLEGDTGIISSLSSDQFTLPAGKYDIDVTATAQQVGLHRLALYNVSNFSYDILGMVQYCGAATSTISTAPLVGVIDISSETKFELRHRCSVTKTSTGYGEPTNFGVDEVYAMIKITKVK